MLTYAEAIGVARIRHIEKRRLLQFANQCDARNARVRLTLVETYRGKFPQDFRARAILSDWWNPSAEIGDLVLVFKGKREYEGHRPEDLGFHGGGIRVVRDLVSPGNETLGKRAFDAIRKVIAVNTRGKQSRTVLPGLNDKAVAVLFELLEDNNADLRRWAIAEALNMVHITPSVGRELLRALEHPDCTVQRYAASHLAGQRYRPARKALLTFANALPKELPVHHAHLGTRIAESLVAGAITDRLEGLDPKVLPGKADIRVRVFVSSTGMVFDENAPGKILKHLRTNDAHAPLPSGTFDVSIGKTVKERWGVHAKRKSS